MFKLHIALLTTLFFCEANATSLWLKSSNSQRGMYGETAFAVGDLVTIDVAESSSLAASQNSNAKPKI